MNNAEWMNQEGMSFQRISITKFNGDQYIFYYDDSHETKAIGSTPSNMAFYSKDVALQWWLDQKYEESILTQKEKDYLESIVRPFKDRVISITKMDSMLDGTYFISIEVDGDRKSTIELPNFKNTSNMYKGMKPDIEYTIGELDL